GETDVADIMIRGIPEYFGNSDVQESGSLGGYPDIKADTWHHLLISWDLKSDISKMWCALDDVNKSGADLPAMNDPSLGPNDHLSIVPFIYLGTDTPAILSLGLSDVPSALVQLPAPQSAKASDPQSSVPGAIISIAPIQMVELAELQIFSG